MEVIRPTRLYSPEVSAFNNYLRENLKPYNL
jgi:hypothetical protein